MLGWNSLSSCGGELRPTQGRACQASRAEVFPSVHFLRQNTRGRRQVSPYTFCVKAIISLCYTRIAKYVSNMLAIRLEPAIEKRLDRLAQLTGRTKTFYVREAILQHLEDLEDTYLAVKRLKRPGKTYTAEEVKHGLGL